MGKKKKITARRIIRTFAAAMLEVNRKDAERREARKEELTDIEVAAWSADLERIIESLGNLFSRICDRRYAELVKQHLDAASGALVDAKAELEKLISPQNDKGN